jgi:hypothetical protein
MNPLAIFKDFGRLWKPEVYHGHNQSAPYFEGWYYKLIGKERTERLALIPGISMQNEDSHSFIQVLDGQSGKAYYARYEAKDFHAEMDRFIVRIGDSEFQDHTVKLSIHQSDLDLKGELYFINRFPWPVSMTSPGAMGPYSFVPMMECYHGILSMNHEIQGDLILNGERMSFSGGKGYTEKDWGSSFPQGYYWMQCNNFQEYTASLTCSVARIPWLTGAFRGLLAGLYWQNRFYKFTTYSGAKVESFKLGSGTAEISLRDKTHILRIVTRSEDSADLKAPDGQSMGRRAAQSMKSSVELEFRTVGGEVLLRTQSDAGAVETGGDLELILAD